MKKPESFPPRSANALCAWCRSTEASTPRCGLPSNPLPPRSAAPQTLHEWVRRHEIDTGQRDGITTTERAAHQGAGARGQGAAPGQRDPEAGQRVFRPGGARPPSQVLRAFVDQHREAYGVEPICKVLQIAPSGYRRHAAQQRNPALRCARAQRDDVLMPHIERVWQANLQVYGADKVWQQMNREGVDSGPLHGRAADATPGLARRHARQGGAHHDQRCQGTVPAGPGQPAVQGRSAQPALGLGLHLRLDLAGLAVRGLRHRRVRPAHRRLAGEQFDAHGLRAGCPGAGAVRPATRARRQP